MTVISSTELRIAVLTADVAAVGARAVQVTNPTPGAGTCASNSVNLAVAAGQALSVSPTTGPTGTEFAVTLTNGTGVGWLTFVPVGAPSTTFGEWIYVSSLPSAGGTRTWRVTPTTPGSYEVRLNSDGYNRAATSAPFAVGF